MGQGAGTCKHLKKDGSPCNAHLDARGQHAMCCQCGGWCGRRHDRVRDVLTAFAEEHGGAAWTEAVLPYAAPGADEARMDNVIRTRQAAGRKLVDVTVVKPLSQEMARHGMAARSRRRRVGRSSAQAVQVPQC